MSAIYYKGQKYTGPTLNLGSGSLTTDDKTIVGGINEINSSIDVLNTALGDKQNTLVSGTNIKTINNESILGSGNISINVSIPVATTSANGLMSSTDKVAVDKIGTGTLNTTNKNIIAAINELASKGVTTNIATLKSGSVTSSSTVTVKTTAAGLIFINVTAGSYAPNIRSLSGGTTLVGPIHTGYTGWCSAIVYATKGTNISVRPEASTGNPTIYIYQISFS